jgi:hypothetical protein
LAVAAAAALISASPFCPANFSFTAILDAFVKIVLASLLTP